MNPFLLPTRELLADWKAFRRSLVSHPEIEQLNDVALYWAKAPLVEHAYDLSEPAEWTTPWEMITSNRWCRFSTAIGMEFTLRLSGWDPSRMALKFIVDYDLADTFFVLEIDGQWWLNHEYGKVIPVGGDYEVLCGWRFDGRGYIALENNPAVRAA